MASADWRRLLLLSTIWGSSFFFIELAIDHAGTLTIVLVRVGLAALALILYCWASGIRVNLNRNLLAAFFILGLLSNALPFTLIVYGQTEITSSLSAIFIAASPLFTVLIGHVWRRAEPATPSKLSGVAIGFAGVALLMGAGSSLALSGSTSAKAAVVCAAFLYALGAVYGRRFRDIPPVATAAGMLTASTIMVAPLAFAFETPFSPMPGLQPLAAMTTLALVCTAFAYILYFKILANAGATNALLVTFIQPVVAILLGVVFLNEAFEPHHLFGLVLIFAGLTLVDGRLLRHVSRRRRAHGTGI